MTTPDSSSARISLVTTVLNDRQGVLAFFSRMEQQTRRPDEIVVVDAQSTDGTWEVLREEAARTDQPWKLLAWQESCNVARGRNRAIAAASHEAIVSTDIGCDWEPEWLEELVAPLLAKHDVEVVIGSWAVPKDSVVTPWGKTEYAFRPSSKLEAKPESQGTSRSIAYRKTAWKKLGGYPEDLTLAADDTCFDRLVKKHRLVSAAAPRIRCYWHRHSKLKGFLKEEWRYFYGDGEAGLHMKHFVLVGGRLAVEALGLIALPLCAFEAVRLPALVFVVAGAISCVTRIRRLGRAVALLRAEGVDRPWLRLIVFEYLTKCYGLAGYVRGYWRGLWHCQDIRRRLSNPPPL